MEITACPICGSKNIGIGTLGDGIISGLSSWKEVCRDCGYQGPSLIFDSESEYSKFLEALSNQKKQTEKQSKEPSSEAQEQESIKHIKEKKNYSFEFLMAIVLTIVFFVVLYGSKYVGDGLFSENDFSTMILFLIGSFAGIVIFFFLFIVFVEAIYRSFFKRKKK
jgi:transcription elongation factor Elf1